MRIAAFKLRSQVCQELSFPPQTDSVEQYCPEDLSEMVDITAGSGAMKLEL